MKKDIDNMFEPIVVPELPEAPEKKGIKTAFGTIEIQTSKDIQKDTICLFGGSWEEPKAVFAHLDKGVIKCDCGNSQFVPVLEGKFLDKDVDVSLMCSQCGKKLNG